MRIRLLPKINAFLASLVSKQNATVAARRASLAYQLCTCRESPRDCPIHEHDTDHTPGCPDPGTATGAAGCE